MIQVGAAAAGGTSGETQTSLGPVRVDQTQQVTVGQRPEIKRLTVDKVPLRESRSLDDTRAKGIALTLRIVIWVKKSNAVLFKLESLPCLQTHCLTYIR